MAAAIEKLEVNCKSSEERSRVVERMQLISHPPTPPIFIKFIMPPHIGRFRVIVKDSEGKEATNDRRKTWLQIPNLLAVFPVSFISLSIPPHGAGRSRYCENNYCLIRLAFSQEPERHHARAVVTDAIPV